MLEQVSVLADHLAPHPVVRVLQRNAALLQAHRNGMLLGFLSERLPHLTGTQPGVVEFLDEGRHVCTLKAEHRQNRPAEREILNPLCRPQCADLRPGNTPNLLRVGAEERVVEPAAEPRRDPFLERVRLGITTVHRAKVGQRAAEGLPEPESPDHVLGSDRIVEEFTVVVDARESAALQQLPAQYVFPEPLDRLQLREEAVAAEVEAVTVELDRLRDAADGAVGLEDNTRATAAPENISGRKPGGATAQNRGPDRLAVLGRSGGGSRLVLGT